MELILNLKLMQIAGSIFILDIIKNQKKIKRSCRRVYKLFMKEGECSKWFIISVICT